jgi:hypothetical protein
MRLALEIVGWWTILSCVLGTCGAWLFFYGKRRRDRAEREIARLGAQSGAAPIFQE